MELALMDCRHHIIVAVKIEGRPALAIPAGEAIAWRCGIRLSVG
jgi:hypothetical protein